LARDTHKFESRYLDGLLGSLPRARRPSAPVIFFQGDEDRVVPPNQAELMVNALRKKGIPTAYLLFSGEQHGFRQAENIKRSLDAELYFYATLVWKVPLTF
jgi:dipeptidyl aminopeptidase/acylaminoacyl peptidase